ncbi:MAG: hypothetical protein AB1352_00250 [Patescibacteria group bacterium]
MRPNKGKAYADTIWKILEGIGMLTVAVMAPNAVQLFGIGTHRYTIPRKPLHRTLRRFERQGYVERVSSKRTAWEYRLTPKGREILKRRTIESLMLTKPPRWDGQWRIVVFDIPENLRHVRDVFRRKLRDLGFRYVNLSVWVYPYECQDEMNAITEYYRIGKYVRYIRAGYFDGMEQAEKMFRV